MSRHWMGILLGSLLLWGQEMAYRPGRILFELKPGYTLENLPPELKALATYLEQERLSERFPGIKMASPVYVLDYKAPLPPPYAAKLWARSPVVRYAEPEYVPQPLLSPERLTYTPNDPLLSQCYNLTHLHVLPAWDSTQGDTNFVWAVVDTDVRFDHPDLVNSIAYNWADTINGIDDDGDGYVDNFHGWDFVGATIGAPPDNDPRTNPTGHGTWVAGFGGATPDNNEGIAGPAFRCRLLPIKAAPDNMWALVAAYDGVLYAAQKGAKVINASWGSPSRSRAAENFVRTITDTYDALIVAAAGNIPPNQGTKFYPAMYDGVLSVTALRNTDDTWPGTVQAYYGIDVCATGWGTTTSGLNGYGAYAYATSFAAPQAAGCAILLRSWRPNLNARQIAELLRITGDSVDHLNPTLRYQLGRRINLYRAITTSDTPACRIKTWQVQDNNDSLFFAGETLLITPTYINYLSPVQNLTIKLSSLSPYLEVLDSLYAVGNLGTLATHLQATPFRVRVAAGTPTDAKSALLFQYSGDGGYIDYEVQEIARLNPPYVHLPAARLKTTISGNGRIGYHDTPQNEVGLGVRWGTYTDSWLFEGGIVLCDTTAHLCTRAPGGGMYQHFMPAGNATRSYTPLYEMGAVTMYGDVSQDPAALPFAIRLKTYGIRHEPANPFVAFVYELENFSGQDYTNLAFGWWLDWDVGNNPTTDIAAINPTYKLVYARNGTTRYAGALLLSPHQAVLHVGRVDTFNPIPQRYHAIFQGLGTSPTSVNGDIFTAISARAISLPAGAKDTIVLALVAGDSWGEFLDNIEAAQTWYQCFLQGGSALIDLGPDRSLCLGDSIVPSGSSLTEYYWSTGANTPLIYPRQSGTYSLLAQDASGCWGYDEVTLTVDSLLPANVQFTPGLAITPGETLMGTDNGPAYDRTWHIQTPTGWVSYTGASFSHVFSVAGTYEIRLVRIDMATGCQDSLSWQVSVGTTPLSESRSATIRLYPNPTPGHLTIEGEIQAGDYLELLDGTGRIVSKIPIQKAQQTEILLPPHLAQGTYLYQLRRYQTTQIIARGLLLVSR
jgi:serine protease